MKSDDSYAVAIFGIPEFERELVERIFSLSESRDNIYRIVDESLNHTADIALVDQSNTAAAGDFERFHAERQDLPVVVIPNGHDPADGNDLVSEFRVKRPFWCVIWDTWPFVGSRYRGRESSSSGRRKTISSTGWCGTSFSDWASNRVVERTTPRFCDACF